GPYGDIGTLYDSVELKASVPPYVDANAGELKLTVGDLIATFTLNGEKVTQIAISAEVGVKVTSDPDTGALRLDVGDPTLWGGGPTSGTRPCGSASARRA